MVDDSSKFKLLLFGDATRQFEQPIRERFPDVSTVFVRPKELEGRDFSGITCAIGWRFPTNAFAGMPDLQWIQSIAVGVDNWVYDPAIPENIVITNTKGLYSDEVAEYICWSMLTLSRRYHQTMINQQKRQWRQLAGHSLAGKTVGIAGMGHLGRSAARYARALGMKIIGLCRTEDDPRAAECTDSVVATSNMKEVLGELDFLVVCVPVTQNTRGLFGADEFGALKKGAIVVNASREIVMDYDSLIANVKSGHLAGAALDVFEKEPLGRWSSLWKTENVLITPHVGAFTKEYKSKVSGLVLDNIDRFRSGQSLNCVVDRSKGY